MGQKQAENMEGDRNKKPGEDGGNPLCAEFCHTVPDIGRGISDGTPHRRYLVNFLVILFGIGACIGVNGMVAEGPVMVMLAPEGSTLPSKMCVSVVLSYVAPALYALYNRSSNVRTKNEFVWISGILGTGTVSFGLLAFFHGVTTKINNVRHSIFMIVLAFTSGSVSGVRNVLLMPYLRNFEEAHLISFFIGEGLSGFIPSVVALIQGVGDDPICQNRTANSTEPFTPYVPTPNFAPRDYFLFIGALMVCSTCAFWGLEYLRVQKSRIMKTVKFDYNPVSTEEGNCDNETLNREFTVKANETKVADEDETPSSPIVSPENSACLRIYLCVLMWMVCLLSHGYLGNIEVFSSRPYGNTAHNMVVNLSQLACTTICILAFWLPSLGPRGITWLVGFAYIGTSYVTWLGLRSPEPPWREETYGVVHLVTVWVILMSLITYVKLTITAIVWKETSDAGIFQIGFALLIGSICSSGVSFYLVNYTALLTPYAPCRLNG